VSGTPHGFPGKLFVHTTQLEEDPSRLDDSYPKLRVSLAGTHPSLSGLLSHWLVGENRDPQLPASPHCSVDRYTGCFNLTGSDPRGFESLNPELAKRNGSPTFGNA
jgi:hypothetical protein